MEKVTKLNIGGHFVGIIGLKEVLEELTQVKDKFSETELKERLFQHLKIKNYIPTKPEIEKAYKEAFWCELKKYFGGPVKEEAIKSILILGPGCPSCDRLMEEVMEVLNEIGVALSAEHITDPAELRKYGLIATPALIINGKLKASGRVPAKGLLKQWIKEALGGD
jgi:hypothetical protein